MVIVPNVTSDVKLVTRTPPIVMVTVPPKLELLKTIVNVLKDISKKTKTSIVKNVDQDVPPVPRKTNVLNVTKKELPLKHQNVSAQLELMKTKTSNVKNVQLNVLLVNLNTNVPLVTKTEKNQKENVSVHQDTTLLYQNKSNVLNVTPNVKNVTTENVPLVTKTELTNYQIAHVDKTTSKSLVNVKNVTGNVSDVKIPLTNVLNVSETENYQIVIAQKNTSLLLNNRPPVNHVPPNVKPVPKKPTTVLSVCQVELKLQNVTFLHQLPNPSKSLTTLSDLLS
jgi:hypothetical protein